jgi:hypothetical protein
MAGFLTWLITEYLPVDVAITCHQQWFEDSAGEG